MLDVKPDFQLNDINLVCTDFFRRHFLVYDPDFVKLGSVDLRRGVWTFTHVPSLDTFHGYSRDDAVNSWLRSRYDSSFVQYSPPGPFQGLKTCLQQLIADFQMIH